MLSENYRDDCLTRRLKSAVVMRLELDGSSIIIGFLLRILIFSFVDTCISTVVYKNYCETVLKKQLN